MAHQDDLYLGLLEDCIANGSYKLDRTGVGCYSVFGRLVRYDLSGGQIPVLTTKKMLIDKFVHEMIWFISGNTNIRYLKANNVNFWDSWWIKGTEEYRPLSIEQMHSALLKQFNCQKLTVELAYPNEIDQNPYQFIADPDDLSASRLLINRRRFSRQTQDFAPTQVHYAIAYKAVFDREARELVAQDIGKGGYGSQWRAWEDTRIVNDRELTRYEKLGYRKVVKIPATTAWGRASGVQQTVVTREIDQLANVIRTLSQSPEEFPKDNWNSRRKIVIAWNPGKLEDAALPPCHLYFQFFNRPMTLAEMVKNPVKGKLEGYTELLNEYMFTVPDGAAPAPEAERGDNPKYAFKPGFTAALRELRRKAGAPWQALTTLLILRSNDMPLGHPFNIAQYGVLTHLVAQCCNMVADELVWVGADVHIYSNQVSVAEEQMSRIPFRDTKPRLVLNPNIRNIDDFKFTDINVVGYDEHWPFLKYPDAAV